MSKIIGKEILKIEGKTILKITAFDHLGYDRGIMIEFDDGSSINITPLVIQVPDARIITPVVIQGPDARIKYDFQKGPNDDMRRDICKCGSTIRWDYDGNKTIVECKSCKTEFKIQSDSCLEYWLEEIIKPIQPWTTPAR